MPKPKPNETEKEFIGRCIPIVINEGTTKDSSQAAAICHSKWNNHYKKSNDMKTIKHFGLHVKDLSTSEGKVAFYFGAFSKDLQNDIIIKEAYSKTLAEYKNIYHNRDHREPVGKPIEIGVDERGAYCVSQMALKTAAGNDCFEQYKAGLITGHSQEFQTIKDEYDTASKIRTIKELRLWGVTSVTNIPANLDTPTISIKSLEDCESHLEKINILLKTGNISDALGEKFLKEYKMLAEFVKSKSIAPAPTPLITDKVIETFKLPC